MRRAFTLIELLVVIAIIAILAAILFPVFARAKMAAKKASDLSNTKQIGLAMQMYLESFDDTYPPCNHRLEPTPVELHWSWMLLPYVKSETLFVSPADINGGWAPGCYDESTKNRGFGWPGQQNNGCTSQGYGPGQYTLQVGRISYTANQLLIPRKRQASDTANVVTSTIVEGVADTILLAPMSESTECLRKGGPGAEFRTYRPTLAVRDSASITNAFTSALPSGSQLWALTRSEVEGIFACNAQGANGQTTTDHVLRYTHPGRFDNGNNYVFADGHAKFKEFYATLNVERFLWGLKGYSIGGMDVIDRATGMPVR
jgi:prepilin-type N-terminal cleavage/methylation domain-containing protein/prepilin-type processing-associated H-X9-DG protein